MAEWDPDAEAWLNEITVTAEFPWAKYQPVGSQYTIFDLLNRSYFVQDHYSGFDSVAEGPAGWVSPGPVVSGRSPSFGDSVYQSAYQAAVPKQHITVIGEWWRKLEGASAPLVVSGGLFFAGSTTTATGGVLIGAGVVYFGPTAGISSILVVAGVPVVAAGVYMLGGSYTVLVKHANNTIGTNIPTAPDPLGLFDSYPPSHH